MKGLEKKLEELLLQKNFEELSSEEQKWALTQISAEEYATMRLTLLSSKQAFQLDRPQLNPDIHARLREKVRLNRQANAASGFLKYSIPAWQVVAAACVLFLLFVNFKSSLMPPAETVYVHLTDTVFDTVYKEVPARLVDSTAESNYETNQRMHSTSSKRINQSPRQSYHQPNVFKRNDDSSFVSLPELNNSFATTYDTAVLNNMINEYLQSPAVKRRGSSDKAAFDLIERIY